MEAFKFRSGKYTGKTIEEIEIIEPGYIEWCKQNRPEMLRPTIKRFVPPAVHTPIKRIEPPEESEAKSSLENNLNFLNEGPHTI